MRWLALLLVILALGMFFMWRAWTHWAPSQDEYPMQGLSVSSDLGEINWKSVRMQDVDFAYIRATTGTKQRDQRFAANWEAAQKSGLRYGAELEFDPCKRASEQATLFITTVPRDNAALPPVIRILPDNSCLDKSSGRDTLLSELNTLLNVVEAHSGKPALIRIPKSIEKEYAISTGLNRTLWLEGNFFTPDYASHPWVMWTASDSRRIAGIAAPVEWNVVAP